MSNRYDNRGRKWILDGQCRMRRDDAREFVVYDSWRLDGILEITILQDVSTGRLWYDNSCTPDITLVIGEP